MRIRSGRTVDSKGFCGQGSAIGKFVYKMMVKCLSLPIRLLLCLVLEISSFEYSTAIVNTSIFV